MSIRPLSGNLADHAHRQLLTASEHTLIGRYVPTAVPQGTQELPFPYGKADSQIPLS